MGAERNGPLIPRPLSLDYEANKHRVARMMCGFPERPEEFTAVDNIMLSNAYDNSWFVSGELGYLNRRGQTIADVVRQLALLGDKGLDRRAINDAAAAEAVTARQLVKIDTALEAIARHPTQTVRDVLGKSGEVKRVPPKSVIASLHWVNHTGLSKLLGALGVSGAGFGQALFGTAPHARAFFGYLEDGYRRSSKNAKGEATRYDYRVGTFTMQEIVFALETLYTLRVPQASHANFEKLFNASHLAGAQSGKKTVALPIQNGNRTKAMTDVEKAAARERITQLVQGLRPICPAAVQLDMLP